MRVEGSKKRLIWVLPDSVGSDLARLPGDRNHGLGPVEQVEDFVLIELGDAEQVAMRERPPMPVSVGLSCRSVLAGGV